MYEAEIFDAAMALRTALSERQNDEKIFVLLDNQAAVMALNTGKSVFSFRMTKLFYGLPKSANVEYRWMPGHSRISGNEEADVEAHAALLDFPEKHIQPCYITLAYQHRIMQQKHQNLVENCGQKFAQLVIKTWI